jgi:hypothetical protein
MNSKFKGFIYPNKSRIELSHFNIQNKITGELRDTLIKWNELNPTINLAITGYWIIERGITFNTIGFNMIFYKMIFKEIFFTVNNLVLTKCTSHSHL